MKATIFKLFIAGFFLFTGFSSLAKEWIPDYHVSNSSPDKSLRNTESMFEFLFLNPERKGINKEIKMSYNGKELTLKPDDRGKSFLKIKPGTYVFKFLYNTKHFEVTTDSVLIKPGYRSEMQVTFRRSDVIITVEKPVIYVYSPFEKEIKINLRPKGKIDFSYPEYKSEWKFTADATGNIKSNGKLYHYLFWDGQINFNETKINMNEGFIIDKNNLVEFFETKLAAMGLNSKEIEDYITYWCPRMSLYDKSYIRFMFNEEYNEFASMTVEPKPDNIFRVFMLWKGIDEKTKPLVKEQILPSFKREGLTLVEWGGGQINNITDISKN